MHSTVLGYMGENKIVQDSFCSAEVNGLIGNVYTCETLNRSQISAELISVAYKQYQISVT